MSEDETVLGDKAYVSRNDAELLAPYKGEDSALSQFQLAHNSVHAYVSSRCLHASLASHKTMKAVPNVCMLR